MISTGVTGAMIKVVVLSLWNERKQVGINEEAYVKPALATGQGIVVHYGNDSMTIPFEHVHKWVGKSEKPFPDKSGRYPNGYRLCYYHWKPDTTSEKMELV